jgi:hypothetical protein
MSESGTFVQPSTTSLGPISASGYLHPLYAKSLAEFGEPLELPRCGGWLLRRKIQGTSCFDAMGCYPLFACQDWTKLGEDLRSLPGDIVSISIVTDPFGNWDIQALEQCCDHVVHFKDHFVIDITQPFEKVMKHDHHRKIRIALRELQFERCPAPLSHVDEWCHLYQNLVGRHKLKGIKAFSRPSFEQQLSVPGIVMFRSLKGDVTVGAELWYVTGGVAYAHLMAVSDEGYALNATYGLNWEAIRFFREAHASEIHWVHLGGGAGITAKTDEGLVRYKRGWSRTSRPVYFCGRVQNGDRYAALCKEFGAVGSNYFPAYRDGEMA